MFISLLVLYILYIEEAEEEEKEKKKLVLCIKEVIHVFLMYICVFSF